MTRRIDGLGWALIGGESVGFVLIVAAVAQLHDAWSAVGAAGIGIIAVCQMIDRRTRP